MTTLSSRERVLTACSGGQPDRVPICLGFFQTKPHLPRPAEWHWRSEAEQAEAMLALGADAVLRVPLSHSLPPEVEVSVERMAEPGEPGPLLRAEYRTPLGTLRQVVRETEDWPHGEEMPLFSDFAVSRAKQWWVKDEQDLTVLDFLLRPPTTEDAAGFRRTCQEVREQADRLGVAVEGGLLMDGDAAAWLMGFENMMVAAMDRPAFVQSLLGIIHRWQMSHLELLLDSDVDIVVHRSWYESADLWSPPLYHKMLAPLAREEVTLTHQAGKLYSYIITNRVMPLLAEFSEIGLDVLWGVDPVQGDADLKRIKQELGGRIAFWGGVNSAVTVARGTRDGIRAAVREACEVLGAGGGLVLSPVDTIFEDCPWENVLTFIEAGRELGRYA